MEYAVPNILIVDDDVVHRMILARLAKQTGYLVEQATTVEEAEAALAAKSFDCISLDLSLGDRGGVEVIERLARQGSNTPLLIVSGAEESVLRETMRRAAALGTSCWRCFRKPVDLAELKSWLNGIRERLEVGLIRHAS